ncbi:phage holin [Staphylococcus ureilyticus]|uniref:phage holin n=1 Tax=Staphylococcus ureilyticus TaxID=94138 RepID=UPI0032199C50
MDKNTSNHFLGINWTVRAKHPQFWLGIVLSILVPPLAYTGTEFNEVTSWGKFFAILGDGFKNPYIVLMMIVSIYNTIVDKTTKGFGDSYIAKQYLKPRTDYDPKQALDWEVNVNKKAQAKDKARKEREEKLELEEDEKATPIDNQNNDFEPEQWKDDFSEEVEVEEGLRDVEDDEVIVDNFDSDINNSGVMLDTSQQVEGAIENDENTITDK